MEVRQNSKREKTDLGIGTVDLNGSPDCGIGHFLRGRGGGGSIVVGFSVFVVERGWYRGTSQSFSTL